MDWLASWPSLISPRWTLMCHLWYNHFCCSSLDLPSMMTSQPSYWTSLMSTLTQSHRSTVVTKLNLCQEYLQVPLCSDSCKLTPFLTHNGGLWCKNIAGVSWSSGPSRFQQIMSSVLAGIPGVAIYLDDIVVNGANAATHDECTGWASPHTQRWQVHFCSLVCQVCGDLPLSWRHKTASLKHRSHPVNT